jgi:hypothetical protein
MLIIFFILNFCCVVVCCTDMRERDREIERGEGGQVGGVIMVVERQLACAVWAAGGVIVELRVSFG